MQYLLTCGFDKTFSGNSNENFIAWRKSLLKYAKFISMPDDKLIEYIAYLLHGRARALRFYETFPTETTSNLNKLLNALQNRFSQWSTICFDYTGLLERYQQLDESVEEYSNKVMANLGKGRNWGWIYANVLLHERVAATNKLWSSKDESKVTARVWRSSTHCRSSDKAELPAVPWTIWVILARCRSFGFEAAKFRIGLIIIILCFAWWCEP